MEFQLSYFKSAKMMLSKCFTRYVSIFGKLSTGYRTGKGQFPFQSQRKAITNNVHTTTQLHSSHTLAKKYSKSSKMGFNDHEPPNVQAGFRKGRGTRDQIDNIHWIIEKAREFQKKASNSASLTALQLLSVDHSKVWKILLEMGIPDHLTCLHKCLHKWHLMQVKKQQLELDMEQQTWSKLGKE